MHAFSEKRVARCLLFAGTALAWLIVTVHAQGLDFSPNAYLGATSVQQRLEKLYGTTKAWRESFVKDSARTQCSARAGSLCAPGGQSVDQMAQLLLVTSPRAFDARSSTQNGGFTAVGTPKDQGGCNTCVAFAILAAAQSAIACALKVDATSRVSEQDFFFCKSLPAGEERICSSSWTMRGGLEALVQITRAKNYPTVEVCMPYNPKSPECAYECEDVDPNLKQGDFSFVKLDNAWEMQKHIRNHGSVVTRLNIWSDLKDFFKMNPTGIYPGHGPKATFQEAHAIQLVGYNLDQKYWLAKTSWGQDFANNGFFKIAFGADAVGDPSDTFGLKFKPFQPTPKPISRLSASRSRPGCYDYRALPSDYVSKVAQTWGLSIQQKWLEGYTLALCGMQDPGAPAALSKAPPAPEPLPKAAPAPTPAPKVVQMPPAYTPGPKPAPEPAPAPAPAQPHAPTVPWEPAPPAWTGLKGQTLLGYTFGSDTGPYLNISRDICDIKSLLNSKGPDYQGAKRIYMDGLHIKMPSKQGSLVSMRRMVTDPKPGDEPTWQLYQKHFNNPVWMDDLLMRAFADIPPFDEDEQRVQLIAKTLESSMQFSNVMHELEAAISKARAGKLSPESGAPYSVDKTWAIFVGGNDNCGLATVALKRANEFGTKKTCEQSWVEYNVLQAMKAAQAAARKGDVAALTKARDTIRSQLAATFIQATITYAHEMYLDKLTADELSLRDVSPAEHQAEAFVFYRTIAPLVAQANKTAGWALDYWLFPGQPVPDDVDLKAARAFHAAYKGLGVTPKDAGLYGRKQPELGCKAYVDKTTGRLLSSTRAKDSLRPPRATAAAPRAVAAAPWAAVASPSAFP